MANGDAPPPDVPHFDTRFMVQTPDGSTATQVLRTDRPISTDELTAHLAQQGSTFVGYPDAPAAPPPAPTTAPLTLTTSDAPPLASDVGAPSPAPAPAAVPDQTWTQRAKGAFLPERTLTSQGLSIGGATVGGSIGGAAGALTGPAAPVAIPVLSAAGAAVGGGLGEGGQLLYEHLTGATPAEPGTAWERMGNAALRSGVTEGLAAPLAWAARPVVTALKPVAEAAADLFPVLSRTLPASVTTVETTTPGVVRSIDRILAPTGKATASDILANRSLQLTPEGQQTLFRAWWQRQAGQAPEQVANAWEGLSGSAQLKLAGPHVEQMQTVVDTLKTGQKVPFLSTAADVLGGGAAGTAGYLTGHPGLTTLGAAAGAVKAAGEATPYVASRMLQTPGGARVLSWMPQAAQVIAPRLALPAIGDVPIPLARAGAQSLMGLPKVFPAASTLWEP